MIFRVSGSNRTVIVSMAGHIPGLFLGLLKNNVYVIAKEKTCMRSVFKVPTGVTDSWALSKVTASILTCTRTLF